MTTPLISADELRERLGTSLGTSLGQVGTVTVLDVRYRTGGPPGLGEYVDGHVPGAAYVDVDTALADPPGAGGRHPLPDPARFEAAMRMAGVCNDRPVVVYDDWAGHAAARAWWLLRYHGHQDVRVLDGAWAAWREAGGEVETGHAEARPGDFTSRPGAMPMVEADGVPAVGVLVDARAVERYRGEVEPIDPVAGRIPGAVNVPTSRNVTDGRPLPVAGRAARPLCGGRRGRGRRRGGVLRIRGDRGARRARDGGRRCPGGPVSRQLERVDHRSGPAGGYQ